MNTRPAASVRRRGFAWLPWALAAAFAAHLVLVRGLHLYKAGPVLGHVLEACGAAAVLIWVRLGLRRLEDLPAAHASQPSMDYDAVYSDSGFAGPGFPRWMSDVNPTTGSIMVNEYVDADGNPYGVDLDDVGR